MRRKETELSPDLCSLNGKLILTLILNRFIGLHTPFDPGDREAYRAMCYALKTVS